MTDEDDELVVAKVSSMDAISSISVVLYATNSAEVRSRDTSKADSNLHGNSKSFFSKWGFHGETSIMENSRNCVYNQHIRIV